MQLYYAASYYYTLFHRFSGSIEELAPWAPENVLLGNCTKVPVLEVSIDGQEYVAYVGNKEGTRVAQITSDRYLIVSDA